MTVDEKAFLIDIYNRFPKYSANRVYLERLVREASSGPGILVKCAEKYGLTLNEMCTILDEKDVFNNEGNLNVTRLNEFALSASNWKKKREESAKRHFHQSVFRATSKGKSRPNISLSVVPETLMGKMDARSYSHLLCEPYERILEVLAPEPSMVRAYTKLFDKFAINYRVPDEVIAAMIHFMLTERRSWSFAYFEALASDLLSRRIEDFHGALQHFQNRLNWREAASSKKRNSSRPASRKPAPRKEVAGKSDERVSEAELEEMIRRANEELK